MQTFLSLALAVYFIFYAFEGLIRYGLHAIGADALIFLRDIALIIPLVFIFIYQVLHRKLHPAYLIFLGIIILHGSVMLLNIGSGVAVVYSIKILLTPLAGALGVSFLFHPNRIAVGFIFFLWSVSWAGIAVDKYYVDFPWVGMKANINDVEVEISRDWQISGEDKRAGGFMRSSINASTIEPLMALILLFNLRSIPLRLLVAMLTIPALVWTTQKGPIIAYLLTLGLLTLRPSRPIPFLRIGVLLMLSLAIALPVILPGYTMPSAKGVFSFSSFYERVESMWPHAWQWIDRHEIFPFGVGLGGISGAQRLYSPDEVNAADNVFILMYAYFGAMTFLYLGAVALIAVWVPNNSSKAAGQAMATLLFLFCYGCVISILEDQMASLFLGAAIACVCREIRHNRQPASPGVPG